MLRKEVSTGCNGPRRFTSAAGAHARLQPHAVWAGGSPLGTDCTWFHAGSSLGCALGGHTACTT
eukprot:8937451-Alexandrium_andersonii.AAC.1